MTQRQRALALIRRDLQPGELPDPPENLDFLELPEAFQDIVSERFRVGVQLTARNDAHASFAYGEQVAGMRARRDKFAKAHNLRRVAERTRIRANKASLGEHGLEQYLAAHRADNSGSAK